MAPDLIDGWTERDLLIKLYERFNALNEKIDGQVKHTNSLESRVIVLEQWRWRIIGYSAGAGAVAGVLLQLLVKFS